MLEDDVPNYWQIVSNKMIRNEPDQSARMPYIYHIVTKNPNIQHNITKTCLFKYIEKFTSKNKTKKSNKKTLIFFIFLLKT